MEYKKSYIVQALVIVVLGYWWYMLVWPVIIGTGTDALRVHFLDVGQGDAILIETPNNKQILIDAGRGIQIHNPLDAILPSHDTHLDAIVMTHPDADHIGGFVPILKKYTVGTIIQSFFESETNVYKRVQEEVEREKDESDAQVVSIAGPYTFSVDGVQFDIIWPVSTSVGESNASSIVLVVTYGEIKVVLTGDASMIIEEWLVKRFGEYLADAEILKAGHHGSKTSTSSLFLNHTKPHAIVYSAGRNNSYGHPHKDVADRIDTYRKLHPEKTVKEYATADGTVSFCITKVMFKVCS